MKLENKRKSQNDRRQLMDECIKNSEEQQKNTEVGLSEYKTYYYVSGVHLFW